MAGGEPPAKRAKRDLSEHLTVLVGGAEQEFMVHKDVITQRSPFFLAAAAQRWTGSDSAKPIELPVDTPEVFHDYLHCLYFEKMPAPESTSDSQAGSFTGISKHTFRVYILADKLGDLRSANAVVDHIVRCIHDEDTLPSVSTARYVFANTASFSMLRRLLVEFFVQDGTPLDSDLAAMEKEADLPMMEFATALLREYARVRPRESGKIVAKALPNTTSDLPKCHYHQHDERCPPCDGA